MERRSQITVTRSFRSGKKEVEGEPSTEMIDVHQFETTPARVRVGLGLTINRGNFESARIDVSVELPCYKEEVEEVYRVAQQFVEERIQKEVAELNESHKKALF